MANAVETGQFLSTTTDQSTRTYYEKLLLDTIRMQSILVNFCRYKEDFGAKATGKMTFTEVLDAAPNWEALPESSVWLKGGHLDSRQVSLELEIHGDVLKFNDYADQVTFWNNGDLRGLVRGKLGQLVTDEIDHLALNAFLDHPSPYYTNATGTRASITATDVLTPTMIEDIVVDLEESNIPGVMTPEDGGSKSIVCVTTPRVIRDIRHNADSPWMEVNAYEQTGRIFRNEVGMWNGVRFIKSNRLHLRNYGEILAYTALAAAVTEGDGAAAIDGVYTVGDSSATNYITVDDAAEFEAGDVITIHEVDSAGDAIDEGDGTQETRRIVSIDGNNISVDRPFLKAHSIDDQVTKGRDVHASIFIGGPSVVMGVGERPNIRILPKIDDLQLINRYSWRGFLKLQMFRPEYTRLMYSAGGALSLNS
jgi:N4-gp56 family major capsid protein